MISGLILSSRAWRTVGVARCLAAVFLVVVGELVIGATASALLGFRVGTMHEGGGT